VILPNALRFASQPTLPVEATKPLKPLTPEPPKDSVHLPGKPFPEAGPIKKVLGMVISAVSLALSLVSMGMLRLPKVPVLSAPFFAVVLGAFAANEALVAAADSAKIPTIHHAESLRKILTAPGYWFSKNVLENAWPVWFGGNQPKKAFIEDFAHKNEALVTSASKLLIQNPIFEDLSQKLRDKRNFGEKASEIAQSFGKVLLALAVGSLLPKPIRAWIGPWLTNILGFPLMERILAQFDQDPNTPGVQLTKPKQADKRPVKPAAAISQVVSASTPALEPVKTAK
jgi:hypothetical protein